LAGGDKTYFIVWKLKWIQDASHSCSLQSTERKKDRKGWKSWQNVQVPLFLTCLSVYMMTQGSMIFAPQVLIWLAGYIKIWRDLVKLLAHQKQLLLASEILRRFFKGLLVSHYSDVLWISDYVRLSKINHIEETLLQPFSKCVHVHSWSKKVYGMWRLLLDTLFQWKWCGTQPTQWLSTQGVKKEKIVTSPVRALPLSSTKLLCIW